MVERVYDQLVREQHEFGPGQLLTVKVDIPVEGDAPNTEVSRPAVVAKHLCLNHDFRVPLKRVLAPPCAANAILLDDSLRMRTGAIDRLPPLAASVELDDQPRRQT